MVTFAVMVSIAITWDVIGRSPPSVSLGSSCIIEIAVMVDLKKGVPRIPSHLSSTLTITHHSPSSVKKQVEVRSMSIKIPIYTPTTTQLQPFLPSLQKE